MTTKDRILELAADKTLPDARRPAAFFLHFPEEFRRGRAAVDKHIEYFRATGNDIMKIQYEHRFPLIDRIAESGDWSGMPVYDEEFFADPLDIVAGLVRELGREAPVILTLYSPFMFAGQSVGKNRLLELTREDPAAVAKGLTRIVESMGHLIRGCIDRGIDGFYASTQGGEGSRVPPEVFEQYIKPADLAAWDRFADKTPVNILHVCDYEAPYDTFDRHIDYPGHIVSAPNHVGGRAITGAEVAERFNRPVLGGMERLGVISTGPTDAIVDEARSAIEAGPDAMILGADCTLAADTDWRNIATATEVAHGWGG